jgi:hypothetical protein
MATATSNESGHQITTFPISKARTYLKAQRIHAFEERKNIAKAIALKAYKYNARSVHFFT